MWKRLREPEGFYPPGYEYKNERNSAVLLLAIGVVLSFQFFRNLYRAVGTLNAYRDYGMSRALGEGTLELPSFGRLVIGHWGLYVPFFLFLMAMILYHYFYYYHETRSIYLMRRLPERGVLIRSCVQGPLLGMGLGAGFLGVLYLLYYIIYLLAIPWEHLS